jgi:hypothetical protein
MKAKHGCGRIKRAIQKGWRITFIILFGLALSAAAAAFGLDGVWAQDLTEEQTELTSGSRITLEVVRGTSAEEVCAELPGTLPAKDENGESFEVPVTWNAPAPDGTSEMFGEDAYTYYSRYGYGPWTFTASADPAVDYSGGPVTAAVSIRDCMEIAGFCGASSDGLLFKFPVPSGYELKLSAISSVDAVMADGGCKKVPISWSGTYEKDVPGTYRISIDVPDGYTGVTSTYAEIVVGDSAS